MVFYILYFKYLRQINLSPPKLFFVNNGPWLVISIDLWAVCHWLYVRSKSVQVLHGRDARSRSCCGYRWSTCQSYLAQLSTTTPTSIDVMCTVDIWHWHSFVHVNPLIPTLKPQSNEPLYRNTVTATLVTGRWWVGCYIWYSEEGPWRAALLKKKWL